MGKVKDKRAVLLSEGGQNQTGKKHKDTMKKLANKIKTLTGRDPVPTKDHFNSQPGKPARMRGLILLHNNNGTQLLEDLATADCNIRGRCELVQFPHAVPREKHQKIDKAQWTANDKSALMRMLFKALTDEELQEDKELPVQKIFECEEVLTKQERFNAKVPTPTYEPIH